MAFLTNSKAPASAPGGYTWDTPDSIVEVLEDELTGDLLRIPDGGFAEVLPSDTRHPHHAEFVKAQKDLEKAERDAAAAEKARSAAAKRTPIEEGDA